MATLYISEYAVGAYNPSVAQEPAVNDQTVAISASHAESSAFKPNTQLVRVHTDAICSVAFGTSPVATATNKRLAANQTEYFLVPVNGSYKVSVITNT